MPRVHLEALYWAYSLKVNLSHGQGRRKVVYPSKTNCQRDCFFHASCGSTAKPDRGARAIPEHRLSRNPCRNFREFVFRRANCMRPYRSLGLRLACVLHRRSACRRLETLGPLQRSKAPLVGNLNDWPANSSPYRSDDLRRGICRRTHARISRSSIEVGNGWSPLCWRDGPACLFILALFAESWFSVPAFDPPFRLHWGSRVNLEGCNHSFSQHRSVIATEGRVAPS